MSLIPGNAEIAQRVHNRNSRKIGRAKGVDGSRRVGAPRDVGGPEGLLVGAVKFFPQETQGLLRAQVGPDQIRIVDGEDLRTGVEMLGEAGNVGEGVRSNRGIVLIVVLQGQRVLAGGVVVEIGYGLVGDKVGRPGNECVIRMRRSKSDVLRIWYEPLAGLALDRGRIEQGERDRVDASG